MQQAASATSLSFGLCVLIAGLLPPTSQSWAASVPDSTSLALPLYFIPNQGQLELPATFYVPGKGATVLLSAQGVTFLLSAAESREPTRQLNKGITLNSAAGQASRSETITLRFLGANPGVEPVGAEPSAALFSWFRGTPEQWKTGLPMYGKVIYPELWPGIDLIYSGDTGRLKYSLEVKPGGDPAHIRFAYEGATALARDDAGGLRIASAAGDLREDPPYSFQQIGGALVEVHVSFSIQDGSPAALGAELGFEVQAYDAGHPLIIDPPSFVYAGLLGGVAIDRGLGIALDGDGNAYLTGQVDTPVKAGFDFDAYVAKISPAGTSLVYYTVFSGSLEDEGFDIAVDADGNAYFAGATRSSDYPAVLGPDITFNGGWDVLISKLAPNGTDLVYSGFLGGPGTDFAEGIAVDALGSAFVEGPVSSSELTFPVVVGPDVTFNGVFDTFVAKIKPVPDGASVSDNLDYCGYIGGSGSDAGFSGTTDGHITIDSDGAAYVSGMTNSTQATFPDGNGFGGVPGLDQSHNGGFDAYVVKVEPDGSALAYATYIGGSADDLGFGIKVDGTGNAYITGWTQSSQATFPETVGPDLTYNGGDAQGGDAFVAKLTPSGTALEYCGYLGGSDVDAGNAVALDAAGSLYVIGYTESSAATFPEVEGPDLTFNGSGVDIGDGFICKLKPVPNDPTPANNYVYCGYIGGSGNDLAFWIALDEDGNAYVAGDTESTQTTFPDGDGIGGLPGWDQTQAGSSDAFVVKVSSCCEPFCDDGNCDPDEDSCNCPIDCGPPPASEAPGSVCTDGVDNDCDGPADCADADCAPDPACVNCLVVADCADIDDDDIRDDNCVWWACNAGACTGTDVVFADVGGQFGACPPDGTADSSDRFHALNCFANTDTDGSVPYPCEEASPAALNVDAGGPFGDCDPDGVCDGHDTFHALNAFSGATSCACPLGAPAPQSHLPAPAQSAGLLLRTKDDRTQPGALVRVEVLLDRDLADLRGYQLHLGAAAGAHGALELVDIFVEDRPDQAFGPGADWQSFNLGTGQMVAGLDGPGVAARAGAYLATFVYRPTPDARGRFLIEALHDQANVRHRTFFFPTPATGRISVEASTSAVITVSGTRR